MTYAVKVMLAQDDWIYITRNDSKHCWDLKQNCLLIRNWHTDLPNNGALKEEANR